MIEGVCNLSCRLHARVFNRKSGPLQLTGQNLRVSRRILDQEYAKDVVHGQQHKFR